MKKLIPFLILFTFCAPRRTILTREEARLYLQKSIYLLNSLDNVEGRGIGDFEGTNLYIRSRFTFTISSDSLWFRVVHPMYGFQKNINLIKFKRLLQEASKNLVIEESCRLNDDRIIVVGIFNGKPVKIVLRKGHILNFSTEDTTLVFGEYINMGEFSFPEYIHGIINGIKFDLKFTEIRRLKDD